MSPAEILEAARLAAQLGFGTAVLQAGEDLQLDGPTIAAIIRKIKAEFGLAITLSLGERTNDELKIWREAGADRYLLRFETSHPALYPRYHPPRADGWCRDRLEMLGALRQLGYEVGSGVMIGLPGQTFADLANDLLLFAQLDLDMIGCGPYIPHPATPLAREVEDSPGIGRQSSRGDYIGLSAFVQNAALLPQSPRQSSGFDGCSVRSFLPGDQVPNDELTTYKVIALSRLLCPEANIPATTALATLNPQRGRELGLQRGANVIMPNLTPAQYRKYYEIYPNKACVLESPEDCYRCLKHRIESIGRYIGQGPGSSVAFRRRNKSLATEASVPHASAGQR